MRLKPFKFNTHKFANNKFTHNNCKQQLDIRRVLMEDLLRDQNSHKKYIKAKLDELSISLDIIGVFTVITIIINCIQQ